MHRISSRIFQPYHTDYEWDRDKVGDYAIVAKHNFYNHDFYQALKTEINYWKWENVRTKKVVLLWKSYHFERESKLKQDHEISPFEVMLSGQ